MDRDGHHAQAGARLGRFYRRRSNPCLESETTYAAFIELHIEQGPLLEQRSIGLGVVTAIAAPASLRRHH